VLDALADSLLEAEEHLAMLARDPALHGGHCEGAAELLAERGDLAEALKWYDRVVARLTPAQVSACYQAEMAAHVPCRASG